MLLYADENFAYPVVQRLRQFGHDVLTTQEDGYSGAADAAILDRAHELGRAVLTFNRKDFRRLHGQVRSHSGILTATIDPDHAALAGRIHDELVSLTRGAWYRSVNRAP